jgi:hypothetical protein
VTAFWSPVDRWWIAAGMLAISCGDSREDATTTASGSGIIATSGANTDGDDDDDADEDEGDDSERLDTPGGGTAVGDDGGGEEGCKKVDFLFVIDSSGSMADEQMNLITSFPGFITAIQDTLEIDDFNLMVVDAGQTTGAGCDATLGAGRITNSLGTDCGLTGGKRYATQDQEDLIDVFSCIGSRGFEGPGNEQTMDSLLAAIGPLTQPGACNEGFLREDAVLVITIISDEEDSPSDGAGTPPLDGSCAAADVDPNSAGDPMSWIDQVVASKNDEDAIVVLGLLGDCDAGGICPGISVDLFNPDTPITGAEPAPRLRLFVGSFPFGSLGPICAPDYSPFFEDAVSVIESACDEFVPPG